MAIDATVGGAESNSFVSEADADAYFDARFGSDAWEDASSDDQEKALKQATRHLGRVRFVGVRATATQALAFPRAYPYNDDPDRQSTAPAIPQSIKDACCEEALSLLQSAADPSGDAASRRAALQAQGVASFSVPGLSESYSPNVYAPGQQPLCAAAHALILRWISQTGSLELRPTTAGAVINVAEVDL